MPRLIPQRHRLLILLGYILILFALSALALGSWFPPLGRRGLWFYSGLYAFIVGALLEAPTHVKPAQAFAFSALAAIGILGFGLTTESGLSQTSRVVFWTCLAAEGFVLISAAAAILLKDRGGEGALHRLAESGFALSSLLGRPAVVSFPPFLFGLCAFHSHNAKETIFLTIGWSLLVFARPLDRIFDLSGALRQIWGASNRTTHLGSIIGHNVPGVLTVRQRGHDTIPPGTALLVPGDDGKPNVAVALNYVGLADGLWLKALQLELPRTLRGLIPQHALMGENCARLSEGPVLRRLTEAGVQVLRDRHRLLGIVAPGSDSKLLQVDVVHLSHPLVEGRLIQACIGETEVLYQLLDGVTKEDILERKSTRGYVLAKARKLGAWEDQRQTFVPVRWVPAPNTPVFLLDESAGPEPDAAAIGYIPRTTFPVRVSINELVTHNAAVLGILGVGKTFFALELVERMILAGIRVVIIDLTNQYENELTPYVDVERQERVIGYLQKIGAVGRNNVQRNVEEGGSIGEFSRVVKTILSRFLNPSRDYQVLVVNPSRFEVWRQDSRPYADQASMASLTAAEITRIFSEAALDAVQEQGMTDQARCCLVYEEAHSLVPEWNAVAYEGDKAASNGTARAILQGRKFGLGCLVVTQRTASVTKTILNQCNTVFAMRVFDATGMEFLSNYIGDEYANVLSSLADREAVVFGKASSCADPLLMRVNDRADFIRGVRGAPDHADGGDQGDSGAVPVRATPSDGAAVEE